MSWLTNICTSSPSTAKATIWKRSGHLLHGRFEAAYTTTLAIVVQDRTCFMGMYSPAPGEAVNDTEI